MILRKSKYYWKGISFCSAYVVIEENEEVRDAVECKTCQVGHWGSLLALSLGFDLRQLHLCVVGEPRYWATVSIWK